MRKQREKKTTQKTESIGIFYCTKILHFISLFIYLALISLNQSL